MKANKQIFLSLTIIFLLVINLIPITFAQEQTENNKTLLADYSILCSINENPECLIYGTFNFNETNNNFIYSLKYNSEGNLTNFNYQINITYEELNKISAEIPEFNFIKTISLEDDYKGTYEIDLYEPFGELINSTDERYTFTGYGQDSETGLLYAGARYYNPERGQFIQPDNVINGEEIKNEK